MTELIPQPTASLDDANELSSVLPRQDPITELPVLILYPHSRCNCRCIMCDIWRNTTRDELTAEDFSRWLPEWRALGVRRVLLSGGEPLMHSDFWALCKILQAAEIGITVVSTGILLKRDAERLVHYCDDVIVSLDGPREVHNRIRNLPRAYEKLAEGILAVREASRGVRIKGRCTVQRENFRAIRETVAAAHELGLHGISFLAADVSTDAFNRPEPWDVDRVAEVALTVKDLPLLAAELDAMELDCEIDFKEGFIAESPAKLRLRLLQYYSALVGEDEFPPVTCNAPWVSTVIESDGTVRPCFFQPPLGNIYDGSTLAEILNSQAARKWRQGLDMGRDDICRKCVCSLTLRQVDGAFDPS